MHRMTRTLSKAVLWAMIPLAFVGSVPRTGCICANGQYKTFCGRISFRSGGPVCNCCHGRDRSLYLAKEDGVPSCCHGSHSQKASSGDTCVESQRPCRPVLDVPLLLTNEKPSLSFADVDLPCFVPVTVQLLPGLVSLFQETDAGDLPPPDLVIQHRVLLI
jgi:hypothetical protein